MAENFKMKKGGWDAEQAVQTKCLVVFLWVERTPKISGVEADILKLKENWINPTISIYFWFAH